MYTRPMAIYQEMVLTVQKTIHWFIFTIPYVEKIKTTDSEVSQQFLNGEKVGQPTVKGGSKKCGNYVYRYELDAKNNKLIDSQINCKSTWYARTKSQRRELLMDKEKNLFVTIGDLQTTKFNQIKPGYDTKAQNIINGNST